MKNTGMVRKLDELGRIVIPIEIRDTFGIAIKDGMEIYTEDDTIILKKYSPGCVFCGDMRDLKRFKNRDICKTCLTELP